jgi:hypothetical protein
VSQKLLTPCVDIPTNVFPNGKYAYGLFSHDYFGTRMVEHGGELPGYSSEIKILPEERIGVIILNNKDGARLNKTFAKAFQLLRPSLSSPPPAAAVPEKSPIPMSEAEMSRYVGTYSNRLKVDLLKRDGRLYLRQLGTERAVTRIGQNRFSVTPPNQPKSQEFLLVTDSAAEQPYMQMLLWVFKKI